ncbi:uncharacterized protein [Triticum aestivum]|uniref:uncharacterized protein isoform X2 n=1 Tax=Triticum aestivum TaxID=4565 RepID=UPI00098A9EC0|nr:uncharacterized protein LOC123053371 isoform X2 [Triticum aestivum]
MQRSITTLMEGGQDMKGKAPAHIDSRGEEGHGGRSLLLQYVPCRPHGGVYLRSGRSMFSGQLKRTFKIVLKKGYWKKMCESISDSCVGMPHLSGSRCRGSNGRGDEPRRAKLRTLAKAAPAQRRGLQRQQHLCMGRNSPWARAGSSSPPPAGDSRAPARLHQRPAAEQQLVSTSGR